MRNRAGRPNCDGETGGNHERRAGVAEESQERCEEQRETDGVGGYLLIRMHPNAPAQWCKRRGPVSPLGN
jgi:hypothetical protein